MCDIGKPLEVIDSAPLALPAPLRKETETPVEPPVIVEAPAVAVTAVEPVAVERS